MTRAAGRRVLVLGHSAARTGAPIALLHLLRWLRHHTDLDCDLVLARDGPLADEYRRVCTVFIAPPLGRTARVRAVVDRVRWPWRKRPHRPTRLSDLAQRDFGLIFANTVTNGHALRWLSPLALPVVCHAHEVRTHFQALARRHPDWLCTRADAYIAVTQETAACLMQHGIAAERMTQVPGFVDVGAAPLRDPAQRRLIRQQHGIPEDAIVVGACGTIHRQKGPDLFVRVARAVAARPGARKVHFVWIGGRRGDAGMVRLQWDILRFNLSARVTVIPSLADPAAVFQSLDMFALTSRNDPLPLVALEAGLQGLPVICFAGNAELVDDDRGRVVPYLDVGAFAEAVLELAADETLRTTLGERLHAIVCAQHDVGLVAPRIAAIIRSFVRPREGDTTPGLRVPR